MEDLRKDTLLSLGQASVNLAFKDLFNHKIKLNFIELKDVNLHLKRIEQDSLFNFNFFLTAFSDTTKQKQIVPDKKSLWAFNIENVSLENIKLNYDDDYGATSVAVALKHLKLKIDKLDLAQSIYSIDKLFLEDITSSVITKRHPKTTKGKSENILPKITANQILINNASFIYIDSLNTPLIIADINKLKLKGGALDLERQTVLLNNLSLSKSKLHVNTKSNTSEDTVLKVRNNTTEINNWKVSAKEINLDDNSLAYTVLKTEDRKNIFDATHLDYRHLSLVATNFYYSISKTEASIKKIAYLL